MRCSSGFELYHIIPEITLVRYRRVSPPRSVVVDKKSSDFAGPSFQVRFMKLGHCHVREPISSRVFLTYFPLQTRPILWPALICFSAAVVLHLDRVASELLIVRMESILQIRRFQDIDSLCDTPQLVNGYACYCDMEEAAEEHISSGISDTRLKIPRWRYGPIDANKVQLGLCPRLHLNITDFFSTSVATSYYAPPI